MTACPAGRTAARPASALVVRLLALTACSGSAAAPVGAAAPVVAPASVTPPQAALVGLAAGGLLDADLPLVVEVTAGTLEAVAGQGPGPDHQLRDVHPRRPLVVNAEVAPRLYDAGTQDWNLTFAEWSVSS